MSHNRLRRTLLGGGLLVLLASVTTLAFASQRIVVEQAAYRAPAAPRCEPRTFNGSALLRGTGLSVSPLPNSYDASPHSQISLLGAPPGALSAISVKGSQSGSHSGHLRGYSQGDGASFLPSKPFSAGEQVRVRGKVKVGSGTRAFAYQFVVATPDKLPYSKPSVPSGKDPNEVQHFRSRPDLRPPVLSVTQSSPLSAPGDIMIAPYNGPGPAGPMIFDEAGNLVWFDPVPAGLFATNLKVQQLDGGPALTWWQGYIRKQGFGEGEEIIDNSSYHQVGRVHAGNGYKADLHDFHITPQETALITVFNPVDCNLSGVGGPTGAAVTDSVFQELDLRTGLVRREWHSLDHVPLGNSYSSATGSSREWPFDYFHINSVEQQPGGRTLISARNTWTLYQTDTQSGQVLSTIGGKHSTVRLADGTRTAYQHDAVPLENGTIDVFDNGSVPKVHPQSRGLVLAIDGQTNSATVLRQYEHQPALSSESQGNIQQLENQDVFVGWGSEPYFSEFSATGQLLFDVHMHGSYQSYRGYRFPWTGEPSGGPAIAAAGATQGRVTVYASWNGDNRTASWQVLAGPSPSTLVPVASAPRAGFETAITTPGPAPYVAVQALDSSGAVLGTARAIRG